MSLTPKSRAVIEECAARSHAGTIDFGSVVQKLTGCGVESYHADYRGAALTYYLPDGATHTVALQAPPLPVADAFDQEAVHAAVRGAQRGEVLYSEFMRRTMDAGCVGYMVWIAGRHVQYLGRRGEVHIERFPGQ
jgi:uncharacterized protein YbcV (DUF1398 family)